MIHKFDVDYIYNRLERVFYAIWGRLCSILSKYIKHDQIEAAHNHLVLTSYFIVKYYLKITFCPLSI